MKKLTTIMSGLLYLLIIPCRAQHDVATTNYIPRESVGLAGEIFWNENVSELDATSIANLEAIAQMFFSLEGDREFYIVWNSNQDCSYKLGIERSKEVKKFFLSKGINGLKIHIICDKKIKVLKDDRYFPKSKCRRSDIFFSKIQKQSN